MPEKIESASGFFDRYFPEDGPRIDQDVFADGVQHSKRVSLHKIVDHYRKLPPSEQYAVFRRLEDGGDAQMLQRLSSFPDSSDADSILKRLDERLSRFGADVTAAKRWEARLAVEEELFNLNQLFERKSKNFLAVLQKPHAPLPLSLLIPQRKTAYEGLEKIYSKHGSFLWDTDRDFDPRAPLQKRDAAFDGRDVLPLDPACSWDGDHDSICDAYDSNDHNAKVWIAPKGTKKFEFVGGKIVLSKTLTVAAHKDADANVVKRDFFQPAFLEALQKKIGDAFALTLPSMPYALKVKFKVIDDAAAADIRWTDKTDVRDYSGYWDRDTLTEAQAPTALHEVGHWFGFRDYYYEAFLHGGLRDFLTRPGYGIIAARHIMASKADGVFYLAEINNLYARLANDRIDPSKVTLSDVDKKSSRHWDAMLLKRGRTARSDRQYAKATLLFLDLISRHADDANLASELTNALVAMGKSPWPSNAVTAKVLRAYETALSRDTGEVDLYLAYALVLFQSGRSLDGLQALKKLFTVHSHYRDSGSKIEEPADALVKRLAGVFQEAGLLTWLQALNIDTTQSSPEQEKFFSGLQTAKVVVPEDEKSPWIPEARFSLSSYYRPGGLRGKIAAEAAWTSPWTGLKPLVGFSSRMGPSGRYLEIEGTAGLSLGIYRSRDFEAGANVQAGLRSTDFTTPDALLKCSASVRYDLSDRWSLGAEVFLENADFEWRPSAGFETGLSYRWHE